MTTDLLIGVIYLVLGAGIMVFGVGVSYFIYRRSRDDEEGAEYGENRGEQILNRLEEDWQFVLFITPIIAFSLINSFVSLTAAIFYLAGFLTMAVWFKMMDDDPKDDPEPVPDSDPRHIDPAGDLADAVESGDLDLKLADDQDAEDLRAFVDAVERGEIEADPGVEATVRIVRSLLDDAEDGSDESREE